MCYKLSRMNTNLVQYVSLNKAAKITGVSITKIYRFIHAGELDIDVHEGKYVVNIRELMKLNTSIRDCELFEPTFMTLITEVKNEE